MDLVQVMCVNLALIHSHHPLSFPQFEMGKGVDSGTDVRCGGLVAVVSVVGAVRAGLVEGGGDCGREVGRGLIGVSAMLPEVDGDWEVVCRKMETEVFQRRFADRAKME